MMLAKNRWVEDSKGVKTIATDIVQLSRMECNTNIVVMIKIVYLLQKKNKAAGIQIMCCRLDESSLYYTL